MICTSPVSKVLREWNIQAVNSYDKLLIVCYFRYEGTGRSLSLKLISQLRVQSSAMGTGMDSENKTGTEAKPASSASRILSEISLNESIRYSPGDPVEEWLNHLLCLDATIVPKFSSGCPLPDACDLYPFT